MKMVKKACKQCKDGGENRRLDAKYFVPKHIIEIKIR